MSKFESKESWLLDESFIKRALAHYGYALAGGLILWFTVTVIFFALGFMFGFLGMFI